MTNDEWGFVILSGIAAFIFVSLLVEKPHRPKSNAIHRHAFDEKTGKCDCGEEWF